MAAKSITQIARHDRIRREVLTRSDMIPLLPEVVTEVLRLLDDPDAAGTFRSFVMGEDGDARAFFTSPGKAGGFGVAAPLIATKSDGSGMVMLDNTGNGVQQKLDQLEKRFEKLEKLLQQLVDKNGKIR